MASFHLYETRKLKTLKESLLEKIVLYADALFESAKTKYLETEGRTTLPLSQHLVGDILAKSHDMCWKIPENVLMDGDLILDRIDNRDRSFMNKWYHFNTGSVHCFDDYNKPVAKIRIARDRAFKEETVRRIASLTHTLKEIEVEQQNMTPQELDDWASRMKRDGPLLELTRLKAACHFRSLPFRFDHRSLRVLEIETNDGLIEWLETTSKCTNLTSLLVNCGRQYLDVITKLLYSIPLEAKLRILCLPSTWLPEKSIHEIMSRLTRLEILEVFCLQPSFPNTSKPKKKLKYFLCSTNDFSLNNLDNEVSFNECANNLAHNVGSYASVDGLLTLCEHTQNESTFEYACCSLLSKFKVRSSEELSAKHVKRIEHLALVAAKKSFKAIYMFFKYSDQIQFSDEFMLRMSCLNRHEFELLGRWSHLERFVEEFIRDNKGSQLAMRFKESKASLRHHRKRRKQ